MSCFKNIIIQPTTSSSTVKQTVSVSTDHEVNEWIKHNMSAMNAQVIYGYAVSRNFQIHRQHFVQSGVKYDQFLHRSFLHGYAIIWRMPIACIKIVCIKINLMPWQKQVSPKHFYNIFPLWTDTKKRRHTVKTCCWKQSYLFTPKYTGSAINIILACQQSKTTHIIWETTGCSDYCKTAYND